MANARKVEGLASNVPFQLEGTTLPNGFWTFDMVQERLVEAWGYLHRMPDREARFLRVSTMGIWREIRAEWGDYADPDERPRMPGLTRNQVAAMDEALGWLEWVKPDARKVIGVALRQLERGDSRVDWASMVPDPRVSGAADRKRKLYSRAITAIATRLNATPLPVSR